MVKVSTLQSEENALRDVLANTTELFSEGVRNEPSEVFRRTWAPRQQTWQGSGPLTPQYRSETSHENKTNSKKFDCIGNLVQKISHSLEELKVQLRKVKATL